MIKEQFINIIGEYTTTQYSWLDVPWCVSALLVIVLLYSLCMMLGHVLRGI